MTVSFAAVPGWRAISIRTSSRDLFHGLTDYREWEELAEIDSLTNERTRLSAGYLAQIPKEQRAYGPGSLYLMAPFAYRSPGRFGDGSFGVLYAALDEPTALAEVGYHRARFLRATHTPRETSDHQLLTLKITGELEELRAMAVSHPEYYDPDPANYGAAQAFATSLRVSGCAGIAYDSLRRLGGQCVAGFQPSLFSHCRHARVVQFHWDGQQLSGPGTLTC